MKKLRTILTVSGLFLVPAMVSAQSQFTSQTEVKETKNKEVKEMPVSQEVATQRASNMTKVSTQKPAQKKMDVATADRVISDLENKIESNKNNPNFNAEPYEQRLKYLRERREEAVK